MFAHCSLQNSECVCQPNEASQQKETTRALKKKKKKRDDHRLHDRSPWQRNENAATMSMILAVHRLICEIIFTQHHE